MNTATLLTDLFFIDIETVPIQPSFDQLDLQWQSLFEKKVSKTMPENQTIQEQFLQKAGILAEFGKIICISMGYVANVQGKSQLKVKSFYGDDEKVLLQQFAEAVDKMQAHKPNFQFCGHNIREFDIPYIGRRMMVNYVKLPQCLQIYGAKPWEVKMVDTLQWWRFGDFKNYTSLDVLAQVLQVPTSKTDMDGSMVQHVYYHEKNLPKIVEYCQRDVVVVCRLVQRFLQVPFFTNDEVEIIA
jgi:3'-5' exonuclease